MSKFKPGRMLPVAACLLALGACGKSEQQTYQIPDEIPDKSKPIDAKSTALRLADAAYDKGDYAMAAQLYFRAAELLPDNASVTIKLGFALFKADAPADAEKIFRVALTRDPANLEAQRGLGHSLIAQGRAADAVPVYRQALGNEGAKADPRLYAGLGAALDMIGRHDEARTVYQEGLRRAPADIGLRNNLALSYAMRGEADKARAVLKGMDADPAAAGKARETLSMVQTLLADSRPAAPPVAAAPRREIAEIRPRPGMVRPGVSPSPEAATPPVKAPAATVATVPARPAAAPQREIAELRPPVPPAAPSRRPAKAKADMPVDSGDGVIFIRTGRAEATREPPAGQVAYASHAAVPLAAPSVFGPTHRDAAMSVKSRIDTVPADDGAGEVLELLAQAERGPRFVWQQARLKK